MLPPAMVYRIGTPAPRAAATSNASARSFTSRSACVSGGGSSEPVTRPTLRRSLAARTTESTRAGAELRLKPAMAPATAGAKLAREEDVASPTVGTGVTTAVTDDALSRYGGGIVPSPVLVVNRWRSACVIART